MALVPRLRLQLKTVQVACSFWDSRSPPLAEKRHDGLLCMAVPYFSSGVRALGHRQCMEILVRQDCEQKCRKEQLEQLKHKLREETQRRRAFSAVMKLPA